MQLSWSKEWHSHDYHAQQPTQTHAQWGTWMHHDTYLHQRRQNDARGVQTHKHLHRLHKANLTTARCCVFSLRSLAGRMDTHTHTQSSCTAESNKGVSHQSKLPRHLDLQCERKMFHFGTFLDFFFISLQHLIQHSKRLVTLMSILISSNKNRCGSCCGSSVVSKCVQLIV